MEDILSQREWLRRIQEDRMLTTILYLEYHDEHLWEPIPKVVLEQEDNEV